MNSTIVFVMPEWMVILLCVAVWAHIIKELAGAYSYWLQAKIERLKEKP